MKRSRFARGGQSAPVEEEETRPEIGRSGIYFAEALEKVFEEIKEKIRKSGAPVGDELRFPDFEEYIESRLNSK